MSYQDLQKKINGPITIKEIETMSSHKEKIRLFYKQVYQLSK